MLKQRFITWTVFAFCLSLALPSASSAHSLSSLSVQALWHYGRGVISDFNRNDQSLDVLTGNTVWQFDPVSDQSPTQSQGDFFSLATSTDGTRIVTRGTSEILIRDAHTGTVIAQIPRSYSGNGWIGWQPNTHRLAISAYSEDNPPERRYYLELWDADTGELITTFGGYADPIKIFSWHPDGKLLAVSLISDQIIIEDVLHGEQVRDLLVNSTAAALAWSPDGSKLAATANSQTPVNLWRTDTFEAISTPNQPIFILSLAWNADGKRLAGSLLGSGVGIWNTETDEVIGLGVEPDDDVDRIANHIVWHDNQLAAFDTTQRLRVWDVGNRVLLWDSTHNQFHSDIRGMAVSHDGSRVALGYYNSRTIDILDGRDGALIQTLQAPKRLDITNMAWSPSNQQLAVASTTLYLWSFGADAQPSLIEVNDVNYVSWSPDGLLAVASTYNLNTELRVINGQTGEQIESHETPGTVTFPLWSPDGHYLAIYRYNAPTDDDSIPPYQIDVRDNPHGLSTMVTFPFCDSQPSPEFLWMQDNSALMGYTTQGALWRWIIGAQEAEIVVPSPQQDMTNLRFDLSINPRGDWLAVSNPTTNGQIHILNAHDGAWLMALDNLTLGPRLFAWGDDTLFVYDGVVKAYQISRT